MGTVKKREVFLAYTQSESFPTPELLRAYGKSSYQDAYNWLAEKAEQHGNAYHPLGLKYPTTGTGKVVLQVRNPGNGQVWWLERLEVS